MQSGLRASDLVVYLGALLPGTVVLVYDGRAGVWRTVETIRPASRRVHLEPSGVALECWGPGAEQCWRCAEGRESVLAVELLGEARAETTAQGDGDGRTYADSA